MNKTLTAFAYCCASSVQATRLAAGVEPIVCPPIEADSLDVRLLEENGFLYFDLHGVPDGDTWYGDNARPALRADQLSGVSLDRAVIFATNCYLADKGSPMLEALLKAGAAVVIAGDGENFTGPKALVGAGELGYMVRVGLQLGLNALQALELGKALLGGSVIQAGIAGWHDVQRADEDTLGFKAFCRA